MKILIVMVLLTGCYRGCEHRDMAGCRLMCEPAPAESWSHEGGCKCEVKP